MLGCHGYSSETPTTHWWLFALCGLSTQVSENPRSAPRDRIGFAAFCKLVVRIGARRRQQPQTGKGSICLHRDQRFRHQRDDPIYHVAFGVRWIRGDSYSSIYGKAAAKDGKPTQCPLFFLGQQTIAPVQ